MALLYNLENFRDNDRVAAFTHCACTYKMLYRAYV